MTHPKDSESIYLTARQIEALAQGSGSHWDITARCKQLAYEQMMAETADGVMKIAKSGLEDSEQWKATVKREAKRLGILYETWQEAEGFARMRARGR